MKNWKIWTAFLAVFAAGVLAGVVGLGLTLKHQMGRGESPEAFRQKMRAHMMEDIREEVRPAKEALPEIEKAVDQVLEEVWAIRQEARPKLKEVFERGRKRIEAQLTPEQIKRFDALREERRKGDFGFLRLPPPPPPMP